jgi:hypothetical protein
VSTEKDFQVEESVDPVEVPKRIAAIPERVPVRFQTETPPEDLVMSVPHLLIRIMICFFTVVVVLGLLSIFVDAPLEELANPNHTPNPAKAPWYFLGLQELLSVFPPVVAGIILPGLVIIALVIIPYFNVNVERQSLWRVNHRRTFAVLTFFSLAITLINVYFGAYGIAIPTAILYGLAIVPYLVPRKNGWVAWLRDRSLAEWVMTWFVVVSTVLTIIGTWFRGPGWGWVWPW